MYTYYAYITHVHPLARSNWFIRIRYTVKRYACCIFMLFTRICYKLFESVSHPKKMLTHPKNGPFFALCVLTAKTWNYAFSGTPTRTLDVVHFVISHIRKYANFSPVHPFVHTVAFCVRACYNYYACMSFIIIYVFIKKNKMCTLHVIKNIDIFTFTCPYKQNTKFHHFWYTH